MANRKKEYPPEMVEDCRKLFLKYGGRRHLEIEREMRAKWPGFRRSLFYTIKYYDSYIVGWPERYGWIGQLGEDERGRWLGRTNHGREFDRWLHTEFPHWTWNWPHQKLLSEKLELLTTGRSKRLMIFLPPRHGKSEQVTVRYTAWRLMREPSMNVILGSYNQKLANRFSRKIQRIVSGSMFQGAGFMSHVSGSMLGERQVVNLKHETRNMKRAAALAEWETAAGGGVRAVGVGGGVTGFGAGLVVIDDPVKSRAEAESEAYRERVWNWFTDDIYTRLEPDAGIILIQTRWHEDDLAGRLLKEMAEGGEVWDVVSLAALAEESGAGAGAGAVAVAAAAAVGEDSAILTATATATATAAATATATDPLGRRPGEALCPERFDRAALLRIKSKLGSYSFEALYQQRPVAAKGGLFKRAWFRNVVDSPPPFLRWARGYDLAVSTKTSADFTASFRCAFDRAGNLYIADGFRGRIEYPEQRRYIVERMRAESNTQHGVEKALHGAAIVQDLRREPSVRHRSLRCENVDADKFTRALAWANLAEEGKVFLVRGPWIAEFLDEVCSFTGKNDRHDDQVDAVSLAVKMLSQRDSRLMTF